MSRYRRRIAAVFAIVCLPVLAVLAFQAALRAQGNFHEVVPSEFYRAAQLSADALDANMQTHGIRTVINLRGAQPEAEWYRRERDIAQQHGVGLIDFPMSAGDQLTRERALELVEVMKKAPKPILVHCKTGADRTGLVSVLYAYMVAGMDEETAEALSPRFGHFGIPLLSPTFAMDQSWEDFEQLFGIEGS